MLTSDFNGYPAVIQENVFARRKHTLKNVGVMELQIGNLLSNDSGGKKFFVLFLQLSCEFGTISK